VIPANVTQEEARIVSYSAGTTQRNFTLQQTLYDYRFQLRTTETSLNGDPELSTPAADEVLQATLQHVVATYDPINGRRIYVNGSLVSQVDPVPGGTLIDWQREFALVLGNEASGDGLWQGTIRLAAIHRRAMTQEQITQNFDAGVGERFFLLFDISENIGAAPQSSYILFEAAQYDTYAYLFDRPHFVTLDGSSPEGIPIQGVRVAMNGAEARRGAAAREGTGGRRVLPDFRPAGRQQLQPPGRPDAGDHGNGHRAVAACGTANLRRDQRDLRGGYRCGPDHAVGGYDVPGAKAVAAGSREPQYVPVVTPGCDRAACDSVL
jgi:hypothetical protein